MTRRHAIYWAPPAGSPLATFAAHWLGRDPESGASVAMPAVPGLTAERQLELTAGPAHYGFHGTLKAPVELAEGCSEEALEAAVTALAARLQPVAVQLALRSLEGFLALVPAERSPELDALAAACVIQLDALRAPLSAEYLARRRRAPLSAAEDAHLVLWGYPYVLDCFRFHLTLTERLDEADTALLMPILEERTAPFTAQPILIDALCIFEQSRAAAPFLVTSRHALGG